MRQNSEQQDTGDRALMSSDPTAVCQPCDASFPQAQYHIRYCDPGFIFTVHVSAVSPAGSWSA